MYHVIRTTTDKLEDALNEGAGIVRPTVYVESYQWVGGRDWVVIWRDVEKSDDATQAAPAGWFEEQEKHHALYDETRKRAVDIGIPISQFISDDVHKLPDCLTLVEPEMEWGNIRYGRYDTSRVGSAFTGWVEDRARTWIIFLGAHGAPALYWPRRDANGGVIGEPIELFA